MREITIIRAVALTVATALSVGVSSPALSDVLQPVKPEAPAPVAAVPPAVEEVLVTAPEPRFVAPTTRDRIGRIWAP